MTERFAIGSPLSDFLEEQGVRDEAERVAIKRVSAWRLAKKTQGGAAAPEASGQRRLGVLGLFHRKR